MKTDKKSNIYIYIVAALVLFCGKAHAYLDPGAGSMIFQVITASLITVICVFKSFFYRFFSKIGIGKKKEENIEKHDR